MLLGRVSTSGRRDARSRRVPLLQGGGGHDDLEDRAGRVVLADRLVDAGVGIRGLQLLGVVADRRPGRGWRAGSGRRSGCWPCPGRRRWTGRARRRRRSTSLEAGHGGLLDGRVQGQDDVAAGRVPPGEQVGQPADEQPRVVAGEHVVLGALHARGAVDQRVVPGDGRVQLPLGVRAQVLQPVVGGHGDGDVVAGDDDRPALAVVLLGEHPGVARFVAQLSDRTTWM